MMGGFYTSWYKYNPKNLNCQDYNNINCRGGGIRTHESSECKSDALNQLSYTSILVPRVGLEPTKLRVWNVHVYQFHHLGFCFVHPPGLEPGELRT